MTTFTSSRKNKTITLKQVFKKSVAVLRCSVQAVRGRLGVKHGDRVRRAELHIVPKWQPPMLQMNLVRLLHVGHICLTESQFSHKKHNHNVRSDYPSQF